MHVFGSLPRVSDLQLPSRHLGLVTAEDLDRREERLNALADWVENALDLDSLYKSLPDCTLPTLNDGGSKMPEIRIGYARDRAFCFYYEENLRLLRQAGAELVPAPWGAVAGKPNGSSIDVRTFSRSQHSVTPAG